MPRANFDTPDGEDIDMNSEEVVHLSLEKYEGTTLIEMEDGGEIVVIATQLEVTARLVLNPPDFVYPEDDDKSFEDLLTKQSTATNQMSIRSDQEQIDFSVELVQLWCSDSLNRPWKQQERGFTPFAAPPAPVAASARVYRPPTDPADPPAPAIGAGSF